MMGKKDFESSDSDDSDFAVDLQHDSSDDSLQSECESTTTKTNKNIHRKKREKYMNQKNQVTETKSCFSDNQKIQMINRVDNSINKLSPNEEKARADSLWKNFLSDTATSSKSRLCTTSYSANITEETSDSNKNINTKEANYSYPVNFNKKVDKKATANKIIKNNILLISSNKNEDELPTSSQLFVQENDIKKRHISNILHTFKKKPKLTTLEKSKLDWNQFKEEHNLEEEISHFNRGKSGYLERQDFLQRTDSRQFEIEKELRNVGKRKTH